jgi:dipeptidase
MACTTILVGKKASYDGSTIIARNDDSPTGQFMPKKLAVILPNKQPRHYKSVLSDFETDLPDDPLRYTAVPNAADVKGIWAATGINSLNVAMTATETITSNPRVLGADPLVEAGFGEEDIVAIILPYIHSAREGVLRLGELLEKYGTYESNGIAFSDKDEVWYAETIGGHNFIATRIKDDEYAALPNEFYTDSFDFDDAFGAKKTHLCSKGIKNLLERAHLPLDMDGGFNPRLAFGSHEKSDHVYNTPRSWAMIRYFNPHLGKFDGPDARYSPESDDLPMCLRPERKITIEDVKNALSMHYEGTPFDPYGKNDGFEKRLYRPIGISRTDFLAICSIRGYLPKEVAAVEWVSFGSNVFNASFPFYANVTKVPDYYDTSLGSPMGSVTTERLYWASRIIAALSDAHYNVTEQQIERYRQEVFSKGHALLQKYDVLGVSHPEALESANEEMALTVKRATNNALADVLYAASCNMKNGFARSDK